MSNIPPISKLIYSYYITLTSPFPLIPLIPVLASFFVLYIVSTNAGIILFLLVFDFISPTHTSIDIVIIFDQIIKDLFGVRKKRDI